MSTTEYKRQIHDVVAETLCAVGFRKKGSHFTRELADVIHLVSLQSSVSSTSQSLRVTVNLGVWVPALEGDVKPDLWSAHWRSRLGHLMPEKRDVWWDVASDDEASRTAFKIVAAVRNFGLPALDALHDRRVLLDLWRTGVSPGLTALQAERLMNRLMVIEGAG